MRQIQVRNAALILARPRSLLEAHGAAKRLTTVDRQRTRVRAAPPGGFKSPQPPHFSDPASDPASYTPLGLLTSMRRRGPPGGGFHDPVRGLLNQY